MFLTVSFFLFIYFYFFDVPIEYTRVLQNVLSLGSDCFSATFYQQTFKVTLEHSFVTFLPSREKQINSLLLVSVGD